MFHHFESKLLSLDVYSVSYAVRSIENEEVEGSEGSEDQSESLILRSESHVSFVCCGSASKLAPKAVLLAQARRWDYDWLYAYALPQ